MTDDLIAISQEMSSSSEQPEQGETYQREKDKPQAFGLAKSELVDKVQRNLNQIPYFGIYPGD